VAEGTTKDERESREEMMAGGARKGASRMKANSGANGGRSHNGALVEMPGRDLKRSDDNEGPGGRDVMTSGQGGARVPEN